MIVKMVKKRHIFKCALKFVTNSNRKYGTQSPLTLIDTIILTFPTQVLQVYPFMIVGIYFSFRLT